MIRRRAIALGFVATALALGAGVVGAEQWGGIEPGVSTMANVRTLRGEPTRKGTQKVEGYDTAEWVYDGARAPGGIARMTVDFGLMTPAGYKADLVRTFKLEPKPGAFDRDSVTAGWGPPDGVGKDGEFEFSFYKEGLFVYFDKDGFRVTSMVFTPPQPPPAAVEPQR